MKIEILSQGESRLAQQGLCFVACDVHVVFSGDEPESCLNVSRGLNSAFHSEWFFQSGLAPCTCHILHVRVKTHKMMYHGRTDRTSPLVVWHQAFG